MASVSDNALNASVQTSYRVTNTTQGEVAIKTETGPGIAAWFWLGFSLILLLSGFFVGFFIPMAYAIWAGIKLMKGVPHSSRNSWVLYLLCSSTLAIVMLAGLLTSAPYGGNTMKPLEGIETQWRKVSE